MACKYIHLELWKLAFIQDPSNGKNFILRKIFSSKMLNHPGPCHFGPKVVIIQMFTIFAPMPLSKGYWGQDPSNGM